MFSWNYPKRAPDCGMLKYFWIWLCFLFTEILREKKFALVNQLLKTCVLVLGPSGQKSIRERFARVAQDKRATWVICLWFEWIAPKNEQFTRIRSLKNRIFCMFWCFSPFLCPRANRSCCSLLSCSFVKSDMSNLIMLLSTKEQLWENCSGCSLENSESAIRS